MATALEFYKRVGKSNNELVSQILIDTCLYVCLNLHKGKVVFNSINALHCVEINERKQELTQTPICATENPLGRKQNIVMQTNATN